MIEHSKATSATDHSRAVETLRVSEPILNWGGIYQFAYRTVSLSLGHDRSDADNPERLIFEYGASSRPGVPHQFGFSETLPLEDGLRSLARSATQVPVEQVTYPYQQIGQTNSVRDREWLKQMDVKTGQMESFDCVAFTLAEQPVIHVASSGSLHTVLLPIARKLAGEQEYAFLLREYDQERQPNPYIFEEIIDVNGAASKLRESLQLVISPLGQIYKSLI